MSDLEVTFLEMERSKNALLSTEVEAMRQRVKELEEELAGEVAKRCDLHTRFVGYEDESIAYVDKLGDMVMQREDEPLAYAIQRMIKEREEYRDNAIKAETELAALKAVDVNPETMLRLIATIKYMVGIAERGTGKTMPDDVTPEAFVLDYVKSLEALKAGQDSSIEHCLTCANRGRVNGASQETFCEQCIFQRTWRKDHYTPAAPKPEL